MDHNDLMRDAVHQKELQVAKRREVNRELQQIYAELMAQTEQELDAAVRLAYDAGISKNALAKDLGESRVTINDRLKRTAGLAAPERGKIETVTEVPLDYEPFEFDGAGRIIIRTDADTEAMFEYVYDEVAGTYWIDSGEGNEAIVSEVDGNPDSALYTEASAWLRQQEAE